MFIIFNTLIVCAFFVIFGAFAGPTKITNIEKNFRNDGNFPGSMHFTLLSIEDKLRNLENTLSVQCATAIDGKIDYYGRKIDNIEKDLSRFQIFVRMELDKISENISSKNFKDDITKDRIIRKIDAVYERIHHKLGNIEGQIDISSIKSQNARGMVMAKLEKMEENLSIRDADMEAELADAVAAVDDLKTTCTNMEENIVNGTKESMKTFFKNSDKIMKKQHSQTINIIEGTNKNISEGMANLQEIVDSMINQSNVNLNMVKDAKEELDENLNEYANKITDMYSDLWKKTDTIDSTLHTLEKVLNITRSEQQNGLRALMIQVGRKSGKQSDQSDSTTSSNNQKLEQLNQKIDSNFETIMQAQNLFLESCHRVQMDEPQLETQISMVLHKVIDIFEKKTSVGPKDIEKLEQLIQTHDSTIRENIYHVTNTLLASTQETIDGKDEIMDYIKYQKLKLEAIYVLLQDILNSNDSTKMKSILETLQNIQQQLNETHKQTQTSQLHINLTNSFITQMLKAPLDEASESNNIKLQQTLEFIKNIYHILMSMEMKINKSYLDYYFNKYDINVVAHRFGQQLNKYIQNLTMTKNETRSKVASNDTRQTSNLILEILGENISQEESALDPYDDDYSYNQTNATHHNDNGEEIEKIVLLCKSANNTSINCEKISDTKYILIKPDETEHVHKNLTKSNSSITTSNESDKITYMESSQNVTNFEHTTSNISSPECLPNYINLIDVRYGTNTSNCNTTNTAIDSNNATGEAYDIDVRLRTSNTTTTDSHSLTTQNFDGATVTETTTNLIEDFRTDNSAQFYNPLITTTVHSDTDLQTDEENSSEAIIYTTLNEENHISEEVEQASEVYSQDDDSTENEFDAIKP